MQVIKHSNLFSFKKSHIILFFAKKLPIYSSTVKAIQRTPEAIRIASRSEDDLAMTTSTRARRRRAAAITPSCSEPSKPCCRRQSGSRHATAPYDQRTSTTTAADEEKYRSEASNFLTYERRRTKTRSKRMHRRQPLAGSDEIHQRQTSTHPPTTLETPPERRLDGEELIPSSESSRRLISLRETQNLTKHKKTYENRALPPAETGIHHATMAQRPQRHADQRRHRQEAEDVDLLFLGAKGAKGYGDGIDLRPLSALDMPSPNLAPFS